MWILAVVVPGLLCTLAWQLAFLTERDPEQVLAELAPYRPHLLAAGAGLTGLLLALGWRLTGLGARIQELSFTAKMSREDYEKGKKRYTEQKLRELQSSAEYRELARKRNERDRGERGEKSRREGEELLAELAAKESEIFG